jgi:hypothetical protein
VGWTVFDESLQSIDGFCRLRENRSLKIKKQINNFLIKFLAQYFPLTKRVSPDGSNPGTADYSNMDIRSRSISNEWHVVIGNTISHLFQEVDAIYDYPGIELAADSFLGYVD